MCQTSIDLVRPVSTIAHNQSYELLTFSAPTVTCLQSIAALLSNRADFKPHGTTITSLLRGRLPKIHKVNLAQEIEFAQNPSTNFL